MKFTQHPPINTVLKILFWTWATAIWIGSLIPVGAPQVANGDKIEHLLGYAILAALASLIWRHPLLAWLGASLMGIAVEFAQSLTPWRTYDIQDMMANSLGAAIGITVIYLWQRHAAAKAK